MLLKNVLSRKDKGCNAFVRLVREVLAQRSPPCHRVRNAALDQYCAAQGLRRRPETSGSDTTTLATDSLMPRCRLPSPAARWRVHARKRVIDFDATPVESPMQQHAQQSYDVDGSDDTQRTGSLYTLTQAAIDALISDFLRNNAKLTLQASLAVNMTAIESVFLHGLRRSRSIAESYWAYITRRQHLAEARDDVNDISRGEGVRVRDAISKSEKWGPGRAWIYLNLNKKTLPQHATPSSETKR